MALISGGGPPAEEEEEEELVLGSSFVSTTASLGVFPGLFSIQLMMQRCVQNLPVRAKLVLLSLPHCTHIMISASEAFSVLLTLGLGEGAFSCK